MDERTLTALKGSISKWEAVVAGTESDRGINNCPLCKAFPRSDCAGCPVARSVKEEGCEGTPYIAWFDHHSEAHCHNPSDGRFVGCPDCLRHAEAELDFLKSLLPAQGMEARRGETQGGSTGEAGDSAVPEGCAHV